MEILKRKKFFALALLVIVLAGVLAYANTFSNHLFWDDDDLITNNTYIKNWSYLPRYFSDNLIAGAGQVTNYWRPLLLVSFATDYHLYGLSPWGYHLTNLIWHLLSASLIFLVLRKLGAKDWLSLAVSLIFVLHPLQTEAVTYVSGRADPMSAALVLASLLGYIYFRQQEKRKYLYLSLGAFILSLLTKEQSIMLPGLIFITEACFFFLKKKWKRSLFYFFPYLLLAVFYFVLRITILDFNDILGGMSYDQGYDSSLGVRLLTFAYVFSKYISLLFWPANLHMAYEVAPITSLWSWPVLSFSFLIVVFVWLAVYSWKKDRFIIFGLAWFFGLLLPRTNIIAINRPLYEHWLYLPMAGFWLACLAFSEEWIARLKRNKARESVRLVTLIILGLCLVALAGLTIRRNRDWRNPIIFYEKNLVYTPNSYIQHNNLGMAYADAGRLEEAEREYRRSLELDRRYPQVPYNLGNLLAGQGRLEEAEENYRESIAISPEFSAPYFSLLRIAIVQQNLSALEETISLMRDNFPGEYAAKQSAYAYYSFGEKEKAKQVLKEALNLYPQDQGLGMMLLEMR